MKESVTTKKKVSKNQDKKRELRYLFNTRPSKLPKKYKELQELDTTLLNYSKTNVMYIDNYIPYYSDYITLINTISNTNIPNNCLWYKYSHSLSYTFDSRSVKVVGSSFLCRIKNKICRELVYLRCWISETRTSIFYSSVKTR